MDDSGAFVNSFAIQIPLWVGLIVLVAVLVGAWKLGKAIWTALS
jgi:hypothetical protein